MIKRVKMIVGLIIVFITTMSLSSIISVPKGADLIEMEDCDGNLIQPANYCNINNIHIKGNWSEVNETHDCIYGAGTLESPYIIENIILDAMKGNSCIIIEDSSDYFIIRNNTLINSTTTGITGGIILNNVSNGNITDNVIHSCNYGIWMNLTQNMTIYNNYIHSNTNDSIRLVTSGNNTMTHNQLYNNDGYGVYFDSSDNNTVSYSIIHHNNLYGIYLDANSDKNWVYENYIGYNKYHKELREINGEMVNVCIYIVDLGTDNVIFHNDEVGNCVPSPVYGVLPPQDLTELITIIITASVAIAVIVSVALILSFLKKKAKAQGKLRKEELLLETPKDTEKS